jgi:hypothetical protein
LEILEPCDVFTIDTLKFYSAALYFYADISTSNLTLECNYVYCGYWSDVTGNHTVSGKAYGFAVESIGYANVDAQNFDVDNGNFKWTSTGLLSVKVKNEMTVDLFGSGNIQYKGHPRITANIKGTGQLVDAN